MQPNHPLESGVIEYKKTCMHYECGCTRMVAMTFNLGENIPKRLTARQTMKHSRELMRAAAQAGCSGFPAKEWVCVVMPAAQWAKIWDGVIKDA